MKRYLNALCFATRRFSGPQLLTLEILDLQTHFSNSLLIHAALTQPEHHILVRWMSLETQ